MYRLHAQFVCTVDGIVPLLLLRIIFHTLLLLDNSVLLIFTLYIVDTCTVQCLHLFCRACVDYSYTAC